MIANNNQQPTCSVLSVPISLEFKVAEQMIMNNPQIIACNQAFKSTNLSTCIKINRE